MHENTEKSGRKEERMKAKKMGRDEIGSCYGNRKRRYALLDGGPFPARTGDPAIMSRLL